MRNSCSLVTFFPNIEILDAYKTILQEFYAKKSTGQLLITQDLHWDQLSGQFYRFPNSISDFLHSFLTDLAAVKVMISDNS